ncbi:hypothetical protein EJ02DRAFT_472576 [Clathrospora elynae]|uniref:Uncharacterized protein n=1 Tax=Clathrospora elynae TaxID=706981 RepID=A0A6A5T2G7_9PLEO|nr:hypothetical protein EJ02DRAFT_472576 [Clathrospora elynae]
MQFRWFLVVLGAGHSVVNHVIGDYTGDRCPSVQTHTHNASKHDPTALDATTAMATTRSALPPTGSKRHYLERLSDDRLVQFYSRHRNQLPTLPQLPRRKGPATPPKVANPSSSLPGRRSRSPERTQQASPDRKPRVRSPSRSANAPEPQSPPPHGTAPSPTNAPPAANQQPLAQTPYYTAYNLQALASSLPCLLQLFDYIERYSGQFGGEEVFTPEMRGSWSRRVLSTPGGYRHNGRKKMVVEMARGVARGKRRRKGGEDEYG